MQITVKLKMPLPINFVFDANENQYDVADLTDAQIRKLGKEWTTALMEHAAKRRRAKAISKSRKP